MHGTAFAPVQRKGPSTVICVHSLPGRIQGPVLLPRRATQTLGFDPRHIQFALLLALARIFFDAGQEVPSPNAFRLLGTRASINSFRIEPGRISRSEVFCISMPPDVFDSKPCNLGTEGPAAGPPALGTGRLTSQDTRRNITLIEAALDAGMNLVDSADVYGLDHGSTAFGECETKLGKGLNANFSLRGRMVLATKGGIQLPLPDETSAASLQHAVDSSLTRLGDECTDLWQVHRSELFAPPAEVMDALDALQRAQKTARVGVSSFIVNQHGARAAHLQQSIVTTQPEFSVGHL
jgi:hypothetical protein